MDCGHSCGSFARTLVVAATVLVSTSVSPSITAMSPAIAPRTCLEMPDQEIGFGGQTRESIAEWIPNLKYFDNPKHLAITMSPAGVSELRQRFVPSDRGSELIVAAADLEAARTYQLMQSIYFEPGFDWGARYESGKIGFGLRGGTAPTGGQTRNDGFSARLVWQGNNDGTAGIAAYVYSSDRKQNLPYGDVFKVDGFTIPVGAWFDIALIVTANSAPDKADGQLAISINGEVVLLELDKQWQSVGQPEVDGLLFASFHGGNTADYSPEKTVYAKIKDVCYSKF